MIVVVVVGAVLALENTEKVEDEVEVEVEVGEGVEAEAGAGAGVRVVMDERKAAENAKEEEEEETFENAKISHTCLWTGCALHVAATTSRSGKSVSGVEMRARKTISK